MLGVLIEAKQRGNLPAVGPVLEALVSEAGFRISDALHARVRQERRYPLRGEPLVYESPFASVAESEWQALG